MNRRHFLLTTSTAAAGAVLPRVPAFAQPAATPPPPVTKFEEIRRGVGCFTGSGGTIGYLVNRDGAVAVDSQFVESARVCVTGLRSRAPIQLLLNTHHHFDHTRGNVAFRPQVRHIVAHANCLSWHRRTAAQDGTAADEAFADTTFTTSWRQSFGDETIRAQYYGPGHTEGDAVITFEQANIVHMGDLLALRAHPNIDRPAGGSVVGWVSVLEAAAEAADNDTVFIAGHGKDGVILAKKAEVLNFRDYFSAGLERARKAGSKDELQNVDTLPGFEDYIARIPRFSLGFVLGICYDEVGGRS